MCSSVAPALAAAAAAASALATLCVPPRRSSIAADALRGGAAGSACGSPPAPTAVRTSLALKSAALAQAEADHARPREAAPQRRERIVGVDHGGRRRGRAPATISPSARATPSRLPKPSRCSAPALVIMPTDGRASSRQRRHFPGAIGAHLDDREAMLGREAQQRQRHADVIVEVAARRQAVAGLAENGRGHLLGRGLAVAAGDTHQRPAKVARARRAPRASARPGCPRPRSAAAAAAAAASTTAPAAPAAWAAATNSLPSKLAPLQRDEQLPRRERARVAHHVGVGAIRTLQPPAAGAREFGERALHAGSLASSSATTAWSRNARRSPPTIW